MSEVVDVFDDPSRVHTLIPKPELMEAPGIKTEDDHYEIILEVKENELGMFRSVTLK